MAADDLLDLYQEIILDHGRSPRNFGTLEDATHAADGHNPLCGDQISVQVCLAPAPQDAGAGGSRIADIRFRGRGCAISLASASIMTEMVAGRTVDEVETLFRHFRQICMFGDDAPAGTGPGDGDAETLPAIDGETIERMRVLSGVRRFPTRVKCATLGWHTLMNALHGGGTATTEAGEQEE